MGGSDDRRVTEYNPCTNTWRQLPSLQEEGRNNHNVCTLDNKIFVLGGGRGHSRGKTCEVLDLSDDDPQWRYIARMNCKSYGGAVVSERKIYVLGEADTEVYDVDQGLLMEYLQILKFDIYRSVDYYCYQHRQLEIQASFGCT